MKGKSYGGSGYKGGVGGGKSQAPNKGGNAKGGSAGALNSKRATTAKLRGH